MNFEEYFQRIGQAEQSVNELNQPTGKSVGSSLPDYMPGVETTAEEYAPGWMRPALNAVRPEWEERRNRWEELGAAALYGDSLKTGQQGELDARVREVMGKNKVFRDFMEEGDKPLSRMYMGREVMRALYGSRFRDVPEMYFHSRGERMPENGRKSLNDGYAAVWDDFSGKARKKYADYQQKKAEFQRGLEEFGNELGTALPEAVLTGKPLTPDMMEKATRYGQAERVTGSLQRARAAVDLLRSVNRGGVSQEAHEGAVHAETEKILQEENKDGSYYRFMVMEFGKPKTEEEAEQQARANLGSSYEVTREFISHLVNVLSDEDGQLDEGALGAMMLALDADAQGQQTIDARFVRNMGEALKRWWTESDDLLRRYTGKDPFNEFLDVRNALTGGKPLTLEGYMEDKQQKEETHRRLYEDPRVERLKSALSRLEDTRLSAADKAGFLAGSLTELGTITGDSAPAVLAGFASGGLSIAAFAPASMNRSIAQAHAEGRQNAELYGLITGGVDALAEGSFGVAVRKVPFVGKLMDKAALGLIGKPVVGKAAAAVQSNWFLRYLGDRVVAESFGELVGEEVISQTGSYLTIQGLRGLGVDMDAPEWKPFSTAWENIQDERQSAATVAYCAALGLMGLSADTRAAREFSRSRENLMTVGLTPETATKLAAMTEEAANQAALLQAGGDLNASKLRELDDKLQAEYRDAYQKEVVNEDPVKLRDRLKKNHDLFMSDVDAQVSLKEGVLKAALREQGVLDVEESLTGKNVVTVEDTEQAEKDRASWQDGQMPEGYETPVKKVEWTDEQLAAYSQYAIGNEGLKRMKAIRSAALNLNMVAKVDEKDYAKTLPLTESAAPVAAELSRSKGAITIDALRALSEAAAREGENGRNVLPGVSNAAVGAMEESFMRRLQWEARSGNTASASRMLAGEGGAAAIRLTAGEGPASRILYNPGHTLSTNLAEDVVESMLVDKLRREGGMDGQGALTDAGKEWLNAMHRDMQAVRRQVLAATGKDIMPGLDKAEPSLMNVAEYFSHLSQSAFYQGAQQYGLNDAAMRHVQFMDSALVQAKFLNDVGAAFAKWADTETGRAWQKEGGTLAGLLRETGHELADLYTSSRITAENVAAVEEARMYRRANGTRTVDDIRAELEEAEQGGAEADAGDVREAYPKSARWRAFVKARGKLWDAGDIYDIEKNLFKVGLTDEVARYDARGNVYKPKWAPAGSREYNALLKRLRKEVAQGDKKRDRLTMAPSEELTYYEETAALAAEFKEELEVWRKKYAAREKAEWERIMGEDSREIPAEESVTGEAIPAEVNEEVPDADPESGQFIPPPGSVIETDPEGKGRGLEGGRYAEDGVEGSVIGMVPFSSLEFTELPYSGYMAADGMAEVLRHADGRMEVIMGGALLRQEQRSMKVRVWDADAAHNEAWARGRALEQMVLSGLAPKAFSVRDYLEYYRHLYPSSLPDKSVLGKLGKKAQQAVTILEKASTELVQDVLSGAVPAADAYAAVETAATQDGQRFFVNQKAADKKASLEYLTAMTRAYEAASGADTGTLQHQARYTVAARKDIRKVIARLQDVRGEKPRAVAQRELGIELPTSEAVADAIKRLALLDASFDAFEADLDIPGRAAEWDGKAPVHVVADFMEAREEVKQMKAGTKAAEAAGRAARERARQEEQDDALMEQARKLELPAAKRWMKPRAVPLTGAQAQEAVVKALDLFTANLTTKLPLKMVLHEIKDGREWYVATDGRRLTAVSRMAQADAVEGTRELLGKAGLSSDLAEKYPEWRQVVPLRDAPGTRSDLVELARFNFLEDARNRKDEFNKPTFRTRDGGWRIGLVNHGKIAVLNPEYVASLLKQVKKLNRELGMPTQAEITCPADPYHAVRFDISGGDWTFTSVLMTVRDPKENLLLEDIILNAYGEQAVTREAQQDAREEQQAQPTDEQKPAPDKLEDAGREIKAHKDRYSDRISVTDTEDMGAPAETTFSVTALDESGAILKPEAFITRPDGDPDWFTIPKRKGQPAMPVRLLAGEDAAFHKGYGLTHIAASRDLDGLWNRVTPERYLSSILSNVSELWEISPGRELLVKGKKPSSWMVLQLVRKDGYYSIVTAHPVAGSKKPNGKKLPLAERVAGKNQTRVDRSQRPANPVAAPGAFPGGQEMDSATLASTAGGGDVFSLPPGARVVNINDVRLRFDDGRQMQAGSPVSTMSLALMDDGLDTAPHLKEHVVQQLIGDVRTAVRRFNRVFAGNTGVETAARELGQAQALLGMINKYAAKGYRPRLSAQMRYVEVYARMLESGKILSYGKLSAQELESLKEDLEADLADTVDVSARGIAWEAAEGGLSGKHELERLEIQARQEVRDTLVKDYAGRKLDEVVRDMLNQGAAQLEKQLKDDEIARIGKLLDFIRPRKDPKTGKLKKGLMNADAYRRVEAITDKMEATPEEKSAQMEAINNRLAPHGEGDKAVTLEEAELDRLSLELLDWSAYGALESMSLDAVRAAGESLRELVLVERNVWESRLEDEKNRLKRVAQDAVRAMGEADATEMRMLSEADQKTRRLFGMMAENVMSFSQAMYAMSGMPGMKEIARETLDALANGHIELTAREKEINNQLEKFLQDELGLTTNRQRTDFIQSLKKTRQTNIVRQKVETHSLDLTVEDAQRWLSMSKEERQVERDRMREEAESKGWPAANVVEEDDLLPLKDAVHSSLNPSPRIDGKKGRQRSRVQVSREYLKEQKPIVASADQMINAILTYEQPFYEENARVNGYTPEVLDALRKEVGADMLAYGYKMRDLLSESGVAEEFERREGVPFPAQEDYWPGRFRDSSRINQERDAMDAERGSGTRYGMLIQRVSHRDEVNLSMGASNVFLSACAQQNNYLIMGKMTSKWRRLLADRKFANALNQKLGDNRFQAIKQMLDLLDGAGVVEAVTQRSLSSLVSMCQSAHAVSVLSLAVTTIAKQPSALMHASAFKSPARVIKQLILDRMGQGKIKYRDMLKLPAFQARYRDDRQFAELMRKGSDATWTRMASLSRFGMAAIEHVDVWSNCASMTALYNLTWKDLEANNRGAAEPMTEAQMKEVCEQTVKNALELVGQPQRLTQRSMMAALGKNNIWVKTSGYMGSEMLNKVGMSVAIGEKSRAEGESAVKRLGKKLLWISTMSSAEQVILMLLDLMRGNGPDDDDLPEWLVYNALTGLSGLGLLNTLPILGPTLEGLSGELNKLITGKNKGFIKTGLLDDMLFNLRGWMRCINKFRNADKMSGEEMALAIADTVRLGAAGTGLGRGGNSTMQWCSTLSGTLQSFSAVGNMLRPLLQRAINEEKKEKKERRERARKW